MSLLRRLHTIRSLYRNVEVREFQYAIGSSKSYSSSVVNAPIISGRRRSFYSCNHMDRNVFPWTRGGTMTLHSSMVSLDDIKSFSTQAKAPAQARQMGALKVAMLSPGFIYEPYAPREQISFWKRWFTRTGWRRTKDDVIIEMKSAYAIAKLRKSGYSKKTFYKEAVGFYKEINASVAHGDIKGLRKVTTERMHSILKNDIKRREGMWSTVYWELIEPVVKIRTLRARLIGVDRSDLNKVFIQLTLEFLAKQKFEAYDSKGTVIAGDKNKEILVQDIWVFEKSLFHPGAIWRLCGKISL